MTQNLHAFACLLMTTLLAALAACTEAAPSSAGAGEAGETPGQSAALCPGCLAAGGETSEFGGDIPCLETGDPTPLALDDPAIATWVERIEGDHELSLRWSPRYLPEAVAGYTPQTSVALSVEVLEAVRWQPVLCDSQEAGEGLPEVVLFEIDVELSTEDGALRGHFEHTLQLGNGVAASVAPAWAAATSTAPANVHPLADFEGSLDLTLLDQPRAGSLDVELRFSPAGLRGRLLPRVELEGERGIWTLLEGRFPDDGCEHYQEPESLDVELPDELEFDAATLADLFDRALALAERAPLRARWADGANTEVELSLGEPLGACAQSWSSDYTVYTVNSTLRASSADGRVSAQWPASVEFSSEEPASAKASFSLPYVPAADFEQAAGVSGLDLSEALAVRLSGYGGMYWGAGAELQGEGGVVPLDAEGNLHLRLVTDEGEDNVIPLRFCRGAGDADCDPDLDR